MPVLGSNNSTVAVARLLLRPPATSTFPSSSKIAVCRERGLAMLPVGSTCPSRVIEFGCCSGCDIAEIDGLPPTTSTLPSGNKVAVWRALAVTKARLGSGTGVAANAFTSDNASPVTTGTKVPSNIIRVRFMMVSSRDSVPRVRAIFLRLRLPPV
jgi:hypothetical protein